MTTSPETVRAKRIPGRARPTRQASRESASALIDTAAIAVLGTVVVLCVALLAPAIWTTLVESFNTNACATIADARERAACIQQERERAVTPPAKGAIAPLSPRAR